MEPGNKIILETERLLFRTHILADLDAWCAMEMDPLVRRYTGGRPRTRQQAEQKFFERSMTPVRDRLAGHLSRLPRLRADRRRLVPRGTEIPRSQRYRRR